jgi:hypothetical protein
MSEVRVWIGITLAVLSWLIGLWLLAAQLHG